MTTKPTTNWDADDVLSQVHLAAGQVLIGGFYGAGTALPDDAREALSSGELGGVILFRRNIESLEQTAALNADARAAAPGLVPWVSIDQEGGRVRRLTPAQGVSDVPPMRQVGQCDDEALARDLGGVLGRELAALGFNLNFAPDLDVDTNPQNPVIGDRSFGSDPERVSRMGLALARGLLESGVVPCGKHFPGHGDTLVDSHYGLPVLEHDRARLDAIELVPFRRAVAAGMPLIMTAHILLPALDEAHPATLSRTILTGLLREELGYHGVIVSDDLDMAAVAERYSIEDTVVLGLEAGVDLFLICKVVERWQEAHAALVRAASTDARLRARLFEAAGRVVAAKHQWLVQPSHVPWQEVVDSAAHRQVLEQLAQRLSRPH